MGICTAKPKLSAEDLGRLSKDSFFTQTEILKLYDRWESMQGTMALPIRADDLITQIHELKHNPFGPRILSVFSSVINKGENNVEKTKSKHTKRKKRLTKSMTFYDFVRMLTVFSSRCPRNIKAFYAFKMYDYDGDNLIGNKDIKQLVTHLLKNKKVSEKNKSMIAKELMKEADLDGDGRLTRNEFSRVIKRLPDFVVKFQFTIAH